MSMLLGALDIGTQTTSLLAGEYDGEGLTVIGRTSTETHGVRKGFIRDIDAVTAGIRKVRDDMDRRFSIDLAEVTAAISCFGLTAAVRSGQTFLMPARTTRSPSSPTTPPTRFSSASGRSMRSTASPWARPWA